MPPYLSGLYLTTSPLHVATSAVIILVACIAGYRWLLLPRPLLGIPYNSVSARRVLGDIPSLSSHPEGLAEWCIQQLGKLESPICQVLLGPSWLQKPIVLVADVDGIRETILGRTEFDRSSYVISRFSLFGNFHLNFKTDDSWKLARHWVKDLLTPKYMTEVACPSIESSATRLIKLWGTKAQRANGMAFDMIEDVKCMSIDVISTFLFGDDVEESMMIRELQQAQGFEFAKLSAGNHSAEIIFPRAEVSDFSKRLIVIGDRLTALFASLWPPSLAARWTLYMCPQFRRHFFEKDTSIRELIDRSIARATHGDASVKSGLDHMVWRETKAAAKAGRPSKAFTQTMIDETYGMLVAGQHTTSAAIVWMLKYLSGFPEVQTRLRQELHDVCGLALREHRLPTSMEISESLGQLPYLRAVIEEMLRLRQAVLIPRDAVRDTELLGYRIPAGTAIMIVCQAPTPPSLHSPYSETSDTSHGRPGKIAYHPSIFDPERWLVYDQSGKATFNSNARPHLAFGGGTRACWGRKLADLEIQIVTAMLVWSFDFLAVPEALSTHKALYDITYRAKQGFVNLRVRAL